MVATSAQERIDKKREKENLFLLFALYDFFSPVEGRDLLKAWNRLSQTYNQTIAV